MPQLPEVDLAETLSVVDMKQNSKAGPYLTPNIVMM
jgi:hypothetical protein